MGRGDASREKARRAWHKVCFPKEHGGLDIREVLAWNKTLVFQRFCDASSPGSIWGEWLIQYMLRGQRFRTA